MILHIDMDAFFASVEQLDNPDLVGRCVIVGGQSKRGVVAAASYEARKFGIHSAMPIFQARQKCSHLVIVPPRRGRYAEISRQVMDILGDISPLVEQVSIDEAYVDISGCEKIFGTVTELAGLIKARIRQTVQLNCSIGIAPNKFLAKIASDMDKPDGLFVILPQDMESFIDSLPIGKVPGVGAKTRLSLDRIGVKTLGDVRNYALSFLEQRLGKFGSRLHNLAQGIDESAVVAHSPAKSISSESTLEVNTTDKDLLAEYLLKHAAEVGRQIRRKGLLAKTVTLKIKFADFRQITRSTTLNTPVQSSEAIYKTARLMLARQALARPVRLIGTGVSGLVPKSTPVQMELFASNDRKRENWQKLDRTLDTITERFGKEMIGRGDVSKSRKSKS